MTAENFSNGPARPIPGFRSYADEDDRFVDSRFVDDDWDDADDDTEPYADDEEPVGRRAGRAALLVGGLLCAALAVGAAVSWPGLSARWARRDAASPAPAIQAPGLSVQLAQGNAAQPAPLAPPATLAPANAIPLRPSLAAPDRPAPSQTPPVVRASRPLPPAALPRIAEPPPPVLARAEPPPEALAPTPPPRAEPDPSPPIRRPAAIRLPGALDCGNVVSLAQDVACRDPGLRAAERRMAQAYASALAAGVPERQLRRDQVDWLNMREDAAHYSKQAVENMYHQRIQELETLGEAPPP